LNWELRFFGNHITPDPVHIEGSQGITQVTAFPSPDGRLQTRIKPEGQLTSIWRPIKPADSTLRPLLDPRDQLVDGSYSQEIILRYPFTLTQESSVIPRFSALQGQLYELEFSSQLWEIRNRQNFRLSSDDTFPDPVSLPAGDYNLFYHFRHTKPEILEKLKNIPIALEIPISSIPLKFYAKAEDYILEGHSIDLTIEQSGEPVQFYAGIPFNSSMPPAAKAGDTLHGHIRWILDLPTTPWNEAAPAEIPVTFSVPMQGPTSIHSQSGSNLEDGKKSIEQTIRDARLQFLRAISDDNLDEFNQFAAQLLEMDPAWLEVHVEILHRLDSDSHRPKHFTEILKATDSILNLIDQEKLARIVHIPDNHLSDSDKKAKEDMSRIKPILIDALYRQCRTIAYIEDPILNPDNLALPDFSPSFEKAFEALGQWVNTTDAEFLLVHIRNLRRHQQFAQGLKLLQPHIQNFKTENLPFHKKRLKLLEELGWMDWAGIVKYEIDHYYPKPQPQRF
ncbi:MAG: tripeptidyl peptidase II, partial [Verrucomicrobia bacterium]|nr:tripeptidyl peptidase II [Verrucomicrobiota bacterium]